jgi:hypothetical protein
MKIEQIYQEAIDKLKQHNIYSAANHGDYQTFNVYLRDVVGKIISEVISKTQEEADRELKQYYENYSDILKNNIMERLPNVEKCLNYERKTLSKPADYECGICFNCFWKEYRLKVITAIRNGKRSDSVIEE